MSFASLHLLDRESLELHFEDVADGPIAHTEALGVLLFALRPRGVHCATPRPDVERAMRDVVAAAERTVQALEARCRAPDGDAWTPGRGLRDDRPGLPGDDAIARWLEAACGTAPDWHATRLREQVAGFVVPTPPARQPLH